MKTHEELSQDWFCFLLRFHAQLLVQL